MAQNTSKVHVKIPDYSHASAILNTYDERDNQYLLNLIKEFVPESKKPYINLSGDCSQEDRKVLLTYGRTIRGVAKKMLESRKEKKPSFLEKKTEDDGQLTLSGF